MTAKTYSVLRTKIKVRINFWSLSRKYKGSASSMAKASICFEFFVDVVCCFTTRTTLENSSIITILIKSTLVWVRTWPARQKMIGWHTCIESLHHKYLAPLSNRVRKHKRKAQILIRNVSLVHVLEEPLVYIVKNLVKVNIIIILNPQLKHYFLKKKSWLWYM